MTKQKKALAAVSLLKQEYPQALCSLETRDPLQLLVSVRLAAQCTDARVNQITPLLFARYPDLDALAEADLTELEEIVRPCGFYHIKARDLIAMAQMLRSEYSGVVPDTIEELVRLPGVGRKSANLIVGDIYGKPAVVADTHLIRIANLLGLVQTKDPLKVERELRPLLPPEESNDFCHRCVLHGRAVCVARRPQCARCVMVELCDFALGQQ